MSLAVLLSRYIELATILTRGPLSGVRTWARFVGCQRCLQSLPLSDCTHCVYRELKLDNVGNYHDQKVELGSKYLYPKDNVMVLLFCWKREAC